MKYCLIHCYSDFNKGDLGIILSTIERIKDVDPFAEINAISTYSHKDNLFHTDHKILRKYVENVYSSIFGIISVKIGNIVLKNSTIKILKLIIQLPKYFLLFLFARNINIAKLFIDKEELKSLKILMGSDIILSKGGSFLCNENNIRSKIGFLRQSYIFYLIKRIKKSYYIFGQSLGPIYGRLSIKVLNSILKNSKGNYLREKLCLEKYPEIELKLDKPIINDVAFTLSKSDNETKKFQKEFETKNFLVGMTVKFIESHVDKEYTEMICELIEYLASKYNSRIIVFPHVQVDNDIEKAFEIYRNVSDTAKGMVTIYNENYTPYELRELYSKMDILVATRLHSAIFALSANVPVINIAYHGTKSQGILGDLSLSEYVIEPKDYNNIKKKIDKLIENREKVKEKISDKIINIRELINNELKTIINESKK